MGFGQGQQLPSLCGHGFLASPFPAETDRSGGGVGAVSSESHTFLPPRPPASCIPTLHMPLAPPLPGASKAYYCY